MPTRPTDPQAASWMLDFSKSQISPANAICLANIITKRKRRSFGFQLPKHRRKPWIGEATGTDSNAISRMGSYAGTNYSPRMIETTGWVPHGKKSSSHDPGPCKGSLERRPVPRPEERIYFPNIIRDDKIQQRLLEMACNREIVISVMKLVQQQYEEANMRGDASGEKSGAAVRNMEMAIDSLFHERLRAKQRSTG